MQGEHWHCLREGNLGYLGASHQEGCPGTASLPALPQHFHLVLLSQPQACFYICGIRLCPYINGGGWCWWGRKQGKMRGKEKGEEKGEHAQGAEDKPHLPEYPTKGCLWIHCKVPCQSLNVPKCPAQSFVSAQIPCQLIPFSSFSAALGIFSILCAYSLWPRWSTL